MNRIDLLVFSGLAVAALVLLVRWLGFARRPALMDAALAARLAAEALPGFAPGDVSRDVAVSRDGGGALVAARDGRVALVRPLGDRFVVRPLAKPLVARAGAVLRVRPDEAMFPETTLDLGEGVASLWAARL